MAVYMQYKTQFSRGSTGALHSLKKILLFFFFQTASSQPNSTCKFDSDEQQVAVESFHIDDRDDFKDESLYTFCCSCKNHVMTTVTYRVGKMTIVFAAALCLLGCFGGCCLVPFLWKRFQDVEHVCPNCQLKLGKYRRPTKNICCKVMLTVLTKVRQWWFVTFVPVDSYL